MTVKAEDLGPGDLIHGESVFTPGIWYEGTFERLISEKTPFVVIRNPRLVKGFGFQPSPEGQIYLSTGSITRILKAKGESTVTPREDIFAEDTDIRAGDLVHGISVWHPGERYQGRFVEVLDGDPGKARISDAVDSSGRKVGGTGQFIISTETMKLVDKHQNTPRADILEEAGRLVHSDRNATYGEPTQNFKDTAALWNIQLAHKLKEPLTSTDVALLLIQLKLARIKAAPKRDNWADIIGYAACGFECDVSEGVISE